MALTDHCDVFGSAHEDGINRIATHVMRQRPSLFNYGTQLFASNHELLCEPIHPHPEVVRRGNPLITIEDPLPILGTDGLLGLDFCFQLTRLELDVHPGNRFSLPPQLGTLPAQQMALRTEVCGAVGCPDRELSERYGDIIAAIARYESQGKIADVPLPPLQPIPTKRFECFCLELFATLSARIVTTAGTPTLGLFLEGLEIVDVKPDPLESTMECVIATTLRVGILPRLRVALDAFTFELGKFASLSVSPTPTSSAVPHNPALEQDRIKAFVNVAVGP
jgi:hypothetical protein